MAASPFSTPRQEFRVLQRLSDFEVREYEPCVLAEVKVSADYSTAASAAFGSLFNYISKGNKASQKIAMTAPVISAQPEGAIDADEWHVSFVMPAGSTMENLPDPNDVRVRMRAMGAEKCVAMSFRGRASAGKSAAMIAKLREAAAREKIELSNESRIARFDPPFKPGILQYNEIVIPIAI